MAYLSILVIERLYGYTCPMTSSGYFKAFASLSALRKATQVSESKMAQSSQVFYALYICSLYMLYMYMLLYIPGVCSSLKAWLLQLCTPRYESTHLEEKPWYDGKGHLLINHENTLSLHPHAFSQMNSEISSIYLFLYLKPYVVAAFPKEIISPFVTFCFMPPKIIKMSTHMKPYECRRKPLYFR